MRARIDSKYALGLQLTDPGFDFSVLCEFRARLVEGGKQRLLLEKLLEECKERGHLEARGTQRTDSTHVLGALRVLSKWERAAETLRAALNALASVAPEWLTERADPEWPEYRGGFASLYCARAGIEGTFSQGVRAFGLRKARYRGLKKTHLQELATAASINVCRITDWLNDIPLAATRRSRLAALAHAS